MTLAREQRRQVWGTCGAPPGTLTPTRLDVAAELPSQYWRETRCVGSGPGSGPWFGTLQSTVPGRLFIPLENNHIKVYEGVPAAPLQESQRTGRKPGSQAWHRVDVCGFIRRAVSQLLPCLAPEDSKGGRGLACLLHGVVTHSPTCRAAPAPWTRHRQRGS